MTSIQSSKPDNAGYYTQLFFHRSNFRTREISADKRILLASEQGQRCRALIVLSVIWAMRLGQQAAWLRGQRSRSEVEKRACPNWHEGDLIFPSTYGTPFAKTDLQRDFG